MFVELRILRVGQTDCGSSKKPLEPWKRSVCSHLITTARQRCSCLADTAHCTHDRPCFLCNPQFQCCFGHIMPAVSIPPTPRSWAPPEMPLETFPPSCGTRKVHYLAHKSPHRSLSWVGRIQFIFSHPISSEIHFNIIFHLLLGFPSIICLHCTPGHFTYNFAVV
jgi:hypothetical protein